jgi:predicted glycosyltransferase
MKSASVKEIKDELSNHSQKELVELCLSLAKFKKENKELLTYLIYEASNEDLFIAGVKREIDDLFNEINTTNFYLIKKSVRKILRVAKKYIRYSKKKETDISLRIYFCTQLINFKPSIRSNITLMKLYNRELDSINVTMNTLHEDLRYDFQKELEELTNID